MKVVVSLSGGLDSSTVVGQYIEKGFEIIPVHFQYGSKHNEYEKKAMYAVAAHYDIDVRVINMTTPFKHMKSNLMKSGGDIPEGHYTSDNMSLTVIPGRNTIFAAIMLGIAESENADVIALGTHLGDHDIYPDCRPEYIKALDKTVQLASDGAVRVEAPFINTDKIGICKVGLDIGVPYEYTRTCYKDQPISCGKCGSCVERLESFAANESIDPILYEDSEYYKNIIAKK